MFHDAVFPKKATPVFFLFFCFLFFFFKLGGEGNFGNLQCIDRMISIQSLQFIPMSID